MPNVYNGGLQPSNTFFGAALTKPKLAPWLWTEDGKGGEGKGGCPEGSARQEKVGFLASARQLLSHLQGFAQAMRPPSFSLPTDMPGL